MDYKTDYDLKKLIDQDKKFTLEQFLKWLDDYNNINTKNYYTDPNSFRKWIEARNLRMVPDEQKEQKTENSN